MATKRNPLLDRGLKMQCDLSALLVPLGNTTLPTSRREQEELEGRYRGREGKGREEGALRGLKAGEKCKTLIFAICKALEY